MSIKYKVIDTPCWPNRWKVVSDGNFRESNAPSDYFPSRAAAELECVRREKSGEQNYSRQQQSIKLCL